MKFIILTRAYNGDRIYVNPNQICYFYQCYDKNKNKEITVVQFLGNDGDFIEVKESPEAIENIIKAEEEK